ncbi:MAG: hypothetical protein HFE98_07925 [Ruminiclostridium sp.]|nr:hypothetical protein [Ruminiclostridium sp.]
MTTFQVSRPYGQTISFNPDVKPMTPEQLQERNKFQAELKKKYDSFSSADSSDLKAIRKQLSANSQRVLNQIKNGYGNVSLDDWYSLTRELKDLNVISEGDFFSLNPTSFTPVGDYDENGNFFYYPPPSEEMDRMIHPELYSHSIYGQNVPQTDERFGDPLKYLYAWISAQEDWMNDIAQEKNVDGTRKYPNVSPIKANIDSCKKAASIIEKLSTL